jgi:GNAT superfamily N-acetyltransferase
VDPKRSRLRRRTGRRTPRGVRVERTATDRAKFSRFGVHEAQKGEGVGTALLEHGEKRARKEGCTTTWLTTPGEHPYLPDLYRRRGDEETGEYPLEDREYDEIVMEKELR